MCCIACAGDSLLSLRGLYRQCVVSSSFNAPVCSVSPLRCTLTHTGYISCIPINPSVYFSAGVNPGARIPGLWRRCQVVTWTAPLASKIAQPLETEPPPGSPAVERQSCRHQGEGDGREKGKGGSSRILQHILSIFF